MTTSATPAQATAYNPAMQKADFVSDTNEHVQIGRIWKKVAHLDGLDATLVTFPRGSSVTEDAVKTGYLGDLDMCPLAHVGYILRGSLGVRQHDGSEEQFDAGDVMMLPPGHEAWAVGDEDCVFVEFSRGSEDYYGGTH
jgi:uncharacterized cupin superfamily protein